MTKSGKSKWAFPLGLVIVLLAVVGLVFLVLLSVMEYKNYRQRETEKSIRSFCYLL